MLAAKGKLREVVFLLLARSVQYVVVGGPSVSTTMTPGIRLTALSKDFGSTPRVTATAREDDIVRT